MWPTEVPVPLWPVDGAVGKRKGVPRIFRGRRVGFETDCQGVGEMGSLRLDGPASLAHFFFQPSSGGRQVSIGEKEEQE